MSNETISMFMTRNEGYIGGPYEGGGNGKGRAETHLGMGGYPGIAEDSTSTYAGVRAVPVVSSSYSSKQSKTRKFSMLEDNKPWWQSKTVISVGVMMLGMGLKQLGFDTGGLESDITSIVLDGAMVVAGAVAIWGRITATKALS